METILDFEIGIEIVRPRSWIGVKSNSGFRVISRIVRSCQVCTIPARLLPAGFRVGLQSIPVVSLGVPSVNLAGFWIVDLLAGSPQLDRDNFVCPDGWIYLDRLEWMIMCSSVQIGIEVHRHGRSISCYEFRYRFHEKVVNFENLFSSCSLVCLY